MNEDIKAGHPQNSQLLLLCPFSEQDSSPGNASHLSINLIIQAKITRLLRSFHFSSSFQQNLCGISNLACLRSWEPSPGTSKGIHFLSEIFQKHLVRYICRSPDVEALNADHHPPRNRRSRPLASQTACNLMNSHIQQISSRQSLPVVLLPDLGPQREICHCLNKFYRCNR